MSDDTTKECTNCHRVFPRTRDYFHRHATMKDQLHIYCKECRNAARKITERTPAVIQQRKDWRKRLRLRILKAYSGDIPCCACCGEHRLEFLAVDHINGGGNEHRRQIGGRANCPTNRVYLWIKKNNYPPGFRVLCHNCNSAIGYYGYCPHERERAETNGQGVGTPEGLRKRNHQVVQAQAAPL